jgi:GT2 family glycosyltransferase
MIPVIEAAFRLAKDVTLMIPYVSIIVPNWNGKNVLYPCLESLMNLVYPNYEIIMVDNGSTDGSKEMVKRLFPKVRVVASSTNLGFAGGCNLGIKYAKGEIIALFNNDATTEPLWLTKLVDKLVENPDVVLCSGLVFYDNPQNILWSAGARIDPITGIDWRIGHGQQLAKLDSSELQDIDYIPGCAFIFPRKLLKKIGFLNENYFLYCEELDWTLCLRRLGYKFSIVTSAVVWHKASFSRRRIPLQGYYHQVKGLFRIYFKHFPLRYLVTSLFFQLSVIPIIETLLFGVSPLLILQRIKAFVWNITNLKETMCERSQVNFMGKLELKERFKELLRVTRDYRSIKYFDF